MDKQNATTLIVKDFQGVKIHTFIAPYSKAANATHIIETPHKLVLIDTQFLTPLAQEFRKYAESLQKPIERVFISHAHPDHYFGLASVFSDCEAYSLTTVNQMIASWGPQMIINQKPTFGDLIPDAVVVPKHAINIHSTETIDGLIYHYEQVESVESELQLVIKLPQLGVVIAQDLVYSGVHLWLGMGWFENWIKVLAQICELENYDYVLAGHGMPCTKEELLQNIQYLKTAQEAHQQNSSKDVFKMILLTAFPHREATMMFDMYLGFLFGEMSSH